MPEIDILKMELDGEQPPDWLAPHVRDSKRFGEIRDKHRAKYLAKIAKRAKPAQDAFHEEDHPRGQPENAGEFGPGGGKGGKSATKPHEGHVFASPNLGNLDLKHATKALSGERQKKMATAMHEICGIVGADSKEQAAIGAWADGAENTVIADVHETSWDTLVAVGAMIGSVANQKAVLVFQAKEGGKEFLASFDAKAWSIDEAHAALLKAGLPFHTLVPTPQGARVYVYGSDEETLKKVHEAGDQHGAEIDIEFGHGTFVGTDKEDGDDARLRRDAQLVYDAAIRSFQVSKAARPDFGAEWSRLRDRWAALREPEAVAA